MKYFLPMTLAFATSLSVACERAKAPPRSDSTHGATGVPDSTTVAASSRGKWDDAAGRVLLVAASVPGQAYVVTPDSATAAAQIAALPHPASVTLFGRGGTVQTADLSAVSDTTTCAVGVLHAAPPPRPWSVGFVGGVVAPLALDSTEAIGTSDSSALVVAITRLASALPNDTAGRFAGLPFVVRSLWRFTIPNGTVVVVASINRQINQEATPLQEHTLIIGERATNDTAFTMAYSERSYGEEETIESRDVLSGVLIGGNRVASLFVVRDYGDATAYSLIERGDDGRWRRRWTSARRHC